MERASIGIMHLPNQRYKFFCKKGINYNILVIGSSGTGKTTFINTLFNDKLLLSSFEIFDCENTKIEHRNSIEPYNIIENTSDNFDINSTITFQSSEIHYIDKKFNIILNLTEIDNIGDQIDNTDSEGPVKAFINDQFAAYYNEEREKVRSLIHDRRIHVCLYFLDSVCEPVRPVDLIIMKEISKQCNLIPVIGRSDILNSQELENFKSQVNLAIEENNIRIFDTPFHLNDSNINRIPYPVYTTRNGTFNWKIKTAQENQFNDLKKILIDHCMIDLIESTEIFYEAYRTRQLTKDYGNAAFNEEEVKISREFIEQLKNEEKKILMAREAYMKRKKEIDSLLAEKKEEVCK